METMLYFCRNLYKKAPILSIGVLFIILATFDFKEFKIKEIENDTHWILLGIGLVSLVIGIVWMILESIGFRFESNGFEFSKVTNNKYSININLGGSHKINIIYGRINDFQEYDKETLVILPANDKFDDECIEDPKSVLGAFARSLYPNGNKDFKEKIKKELNRRGAESFNIGDWISLSKISSTISEFNIGIVAVTHMIEDEIIANSENVMLAFKGINKIMSKKRISKVYMPLIGSGHGGLTPELSLLCILISVIEQIKRNTGGILREINIVIYKKDNGERSIPIERMRKIVKFTLNYCK